MFANDLHSLDSMSDAWSIPRDIKLNAERTHLVYSSCSIFRRPWRKPLLETSQGLAREFLLDPLRDPLPATDQGPLITDTARRSPELFTEFVALADAPAERILAYAQKWGVLELCAHNQPRWHLPTGLAVAYANGMPDHLYYPYPCRELYWYESRVGAPAEPLDVWRSIAQEARALWQVASDLQRGRRPSDQDSYSAFRRILSHDFPLKGSRQDPLDTIRLCAVVAVNQWIDIAGIKPRIRLAGNKATMIIGGHHLFAELTLRLASALCLGRETVICDHCGIPYIPPGRRPRAGSRHYCPDCRASKFPERYAARDYRERKRQAAEGQP